MVENSGVVQFSCPECGKCAEVHKMSSTLDFNPWIDISVKCERRFDEMRLNECPGLWPEYVRADKKETRRGIKPLSAVLGFPRPLTICDWCHSLIALSDGPVFAPATAAKILRMIPKAGRPNRKIGYPPKTLRAQSPPPCKRSPKATKNFKKMQDLESELGNRRTEHARCRLTRRATPVLRPCVTSRDGLRHLVASAPTVYTTRQLSARLLEEACGIGLPAGTLNIGNPFFAHWPRARTAFAADNCPIKFPKDRLAPFYGQTRSFCATAQEATFCDNCHYETRPD